MIGNEGCRMKEDKMGVRVVLIRKSREGRRQAT